MKFPLNNCRFVNKTLDLCLNGACITHNATRQLSDITAGNSLVYIHIFHILLPIKLLTEFQGRWGLFLLPKPRCFPRVIPSVSTRPDVNISTPSNQNLSVLKGPLLTRRPSPTQHRTRTAEQKQTRAEVAANTVLYLAVNHYV